MPVRRVERLSRHGDRVEPKETSRRHRHTSIFIAVEHSDPSSYSHPSSFVQVITENLKVYWGDSVIV